MFTFDPNYFENKRVLITGGTGTFGQACVKILRGSFPRLDRILILSRDETKQYEMQKEWPDTHGDGSMMRYFIGDIRDRDKLMMAFKNVDIVIHAAAMKQVPACEYNPFEAVKTNILGARNIIEAATERGVEKVVALSSDKAVDPVNLYGATKLVVEKLFVAANTLGTKFSVVRYGNVLGSRGSVLPIFLKQKQEKKFLLTDRRMTRFWLLIDDAVRFVLDRVGWMKGGEIFVPKMPSCQILDLIKVVGGLDHYQVKEIGIRPGEKMHEVLVSQNEVDRAWDMGRHYMITPALKFFDGDRFSPSGVTVGFSYSSENNDWQLKIKDLKEMIEKV